MEKFKHSFNRMILLGALIFFGGLLPNQHAWAQG